MSGRGWPAHIAAFTGNRPPAVRWLRTHGSDSDRERVGEFVQGLALGSHVPLNPRDVRCK